MYAPSGDQKGKLAFCVPGSCVTLEEPIRCTYSIGNPVLGSGETNTSIEPSREIAMWLTFISCGREIANCMRAAGAGRRAAHHVVPATGNEREPHGDLARWLDAGVCLSGTKYRIAMLYVQRIGSSSVTQLPGTQNASFPFWSPDGAYIAFFANGKLLKMPAAGGHATGASQRSGGPGWHLGSQNVIIYSPDTATHLLRINADGSGASEVSVSPTKTSRRSAGPNFFPMEITSCTGRGISPTLKTTTTAAST